MLFNRVLFFETPGTDWKIKQWQKTISQDAKH